MSKTDLPIPVEAPLRGCRVLELGSTVAGPFCGRLLADFGAEVIKVESLDGDDLRSMGSRQDGESLYAASLFRNKRLISVDLRRAEGQKIIHNVSRSCDIVVENFRPGTLEKWNLGYDQLKAINPQIILVRVSGYGQSGPYSGRPGYGITCEAISGLRDITGYPDLPPVRVSTSLTDYVSGMYAAFGALLALRHRDQSGQGQIVDTALYEGAFSFMEPHITAFSNLGKVAQRSGSRLPNSTPNNIYPSKDEGWILIAAPAQSTFARLTQAMDAPELFKDPRFSTAVKRSENETEIDRIITDWTSGLGQKEIEKILVSAGVPVARVYNVQDIFADPHYQARDMLVRTPHETLGKVTLPGVVPKLSKTPGAIRWPGRQTGQDTCEVLMELGAFSEQEVLQLQREGVVKTCNSQFHPGGQYYEV